MRYSLETLLRIDNAIAKLDSFAVQAWNQYRKGRDVGAYARYYFLAEERDSLIAEYDSLCYRMFPDM